MARQIGVFWPVGAILETFIAAGCELRVVEATQQGPDGDVFNLRYLFSPSAQTFVAIVDLDDGDRVSEAEVAFWERRLGLTVPRPPTP